MNQKFSNEEFFILQRMIDGDEIAFKYFFDTYYDDLCNFVNGYLRDETFSEDVIQNIFIYLWEKKDSLPFNCSIKSYLYTASKNKSLNFIRNAKNKNKIVLELFDQSDIFSDESADQFLEFEELKTIISNAIEVLPPKCKTVYKLSRDDGLTNKEIAERLGITIKTVENQMTIAIRKIKDFLQPYQDQIFIFFIVTHFF
ncbi:MAG TPA: RNA polymerase sigma-70 factor [Prolixibacteraceae bacterium]|nr:RNA polymerase sigma-70 factor [Prolixibacteraceae bacterium]